MKGAIAVPLVSTISAPKMTSVKMIGKSQYFLLALRNPQRSIKNSMISLPEFFQYGFSRSFAEKAIFLLVNAEPLFPLFLRFIASAPDC